MKFFLSFYNDLLPAVILYWTSLGLFTCTQSSTRQIIENYQDDEEGQEEDENLQLFLMKKMLFSLWWPNSLRLRLWGLKFLKGWQCNSVMSCFSIRSTRNMATWPVTICNNHNCREGKGATWFRAHSPRPFADCHSPDSSSSSWRSIQSFRDVIGPSSTASISEGAQETLVRGQFEWYKTFQASRLGPREADFYVRTNALMEMF